MDKDAVLLPVDDVLAALERLARAARKRSAAQIIAITGSVGKTGTKASLADALAKSGKTMPPSAASTIILVCRFPWRVCHKMPNMACLNWA